MIEKANKKLLESFENAKKRTSLPDFFNTFLGEWKKGGNIKTVAEELGVTPGAVRRRIKYLEGKGGVKIPKFPKKV
jgi:DNA-binding MarR family transcriptional regulator